MQSKEFNNLYEFVKNEGVHEIISNNEKLNDIKIKFKLLNEEDIIACLYLVAIDLKDVKSINDLNRKHLKGSSINNEEGIDIFNTIYKRKLFDHKRIKKVIHMSFVNGIQFKISSYLLVSIINNKDLESLKLILENIFCDNNYIKSMLYAYKFKDRHSVNYIDKIIYNQLKSNNNDLSQLNNEQKYRALTLAFEHKYEYLVNLLIFIDVKFKGGKKYYPLLWVFIENNNIEMVQLLIEYANKNDIILELNNKNNDGYYPILLACYENNNKMVQLLIDYANKNNIILEIDEMDDDYHCYPVLWACHNNNTEIVKSLIDYANNNNIILELNDINNYYLNYPISMACDNNNFEIVKILLEYANKNSIYLSINVKSGNGWYPFLIASDNNNIEIIKSLIDYSNKNGIILEINEKSNIGFYPLFMMCFHNNIEMVHLLIEYANQKDIVLELNEKNDNKDYPLLMACDNNNIKVIKLLMDYAREKDIILELNGENIIGWYPLLWACYNNSIEITQSLMDYANESNIILEMNRINYEDKIYPLLLAVKRHKNIKLVQLLMEYARDKNVILNIDENDLGNISKIPNEIIELFNEYKNIINFVYKENSNLLKKIDN